MKAFLRSSLMTASGLLFSLSPLPAKITCAHPPAEILLLRHACRLSCDNDATPLDTKGQDQAQELIKRLGDRDLQAIFITYKLRTEQTASPLADYKKLVPIKAGFKNASQGNDTDSNIETAEKLVKEICSGNYSRRAVLYVGHSDTLDDVLRELDPSFPYKTPPCGEGWIIEFNVPNPTPKGLPASGITCEKPVGAERNCCSGHATRAAEQ